MPREQLDKIQIHLADNRSYAAVLQSMNVPARFTNGSLASSHASLGRQPAVLRENAINRVAVEPTFLRNEKKIGTRITHHRGLRRQSHLEEEEKGVLDKFESTLRVLGWVLWSAEQQGRYGG